MQKELMLRLRRDGEIVGYEWHMEGNILHNQALVPFGHEQHPWKRAETYAFITHDSFDMGIKVDDEWWFEGDGIGYIGDAPGILAVTLPNSDGTGGWHMKRKGNSGGDFYFSVWPYWNGVKINNYTLHPHLLDGQAHEGKPQYIGIDYATSGDNKTVYWKDGQAYERLPER